MTSVDCGEARIEQIAIALADADATTRTRRQPRRHLLELTPREIAELLELPQGTVNSRMRRGLDALRGILSVGEDGQ
jgi:DNA-directed RNA polymerase specialized sigma24 family protein